MAARGELGGIVSFWSDRNVQELVVVVRYCDYTKKPLDTFKWL